MALRDTGFKLALVGAALGTLGGLASAQEIDFSAQSSGREALGVDTLVERALGDYPGIRAARARIDAAQAQLGEAWVAPFFQGAVTAGFAMAPEARGTPILSPDPQVPLQNDWQPVLQIGIQGVIPIYTFGKIDGARRAATEGVRAAESDLRRVRQQLAHDVRRAYFGLQVALDLQQMLNEGLPQIRQALTTIESRLAEGDAEVSDADRYRLVTALAEVEARQAQIVHLESSSRAALALLTGVPNVVVAECPLTPVNFEAHAAEEYVAHAIRYRPDLRMLDAAIRARSASRDIAFAGLLPDIALAYQISTSYAPGIADQTNPFVIDAANYTNLGAGLVLRWSLDLPGAAFRHDRESALVRDLEARREEARLGVEIEVRDGLATILEAQARVVSYQTAQQEARAWFIGNVQALDIGAGSFAELVDAVRAYFTARYSQLQASVDLNLAVSAFERMTGATLISEWEPACIDSLAADADVDESSPRDEAEDATTDESPD